MTLRRISLWKFPSEPGRLALLWLGGGLFINLLGADGDYWYFDLGTPFAKLGGTVLAALLAAWMLGRRDEAVRFAFAFMAVGLVHEACLTLSARIVGQYSTPANWISAGLTLWALAAALRLVASASQWRRVRVRAGTLCAVGLILALSLEWEALQIELMTRMAPATDEAETPRIDAEALWTAQPALLGKALDRLPPTAGQSSRTFILSVAAGGGQDLFGREAGRMGEVLGRRFGAPGQGIVLSNASADLGRLPLANRTNLSGALDRIGKRFDPGKDLLVIYLASHGSREGELTTNLPGYEVLKPISAAFLAEALRHAGITRRIVFVSACYSGTWIEPLASPDTIVLTASASDRTSFGCDDSREFTVFGEAAVNSQSRSGTSLGEAFADMKNAIDAEETRSGMEHSLPQAYVGENMQRMWQRAAAD